MDPATAELEQRIRVGRVRLGQTLGQLQLRANRARDVSRQVVGTATIVGIILVSTAALVVIARRVAAASRRRRSRRSWAFRADRALGGWLGER
jgi:hypothetical protein